MQEHIERSPLAYANLSVKVAFEKQPVIITVDLGRPMEPEEMDLIIEYAQRELGVEDYTVAISPEDALVILGKMSPMPDQGPIRGSLRYVLTNGGPDEHEHEH